MTINTTNLSAQVQMRLDALTVPTDAKTILKYATEALGLGLDLTNLTLALNATISAINSETSDNDLVALNAARKAIIASFGDISPLNSLAAFNRTELSFSDASEAQWMKTGYIDTETYLYPDAESATVADSFQQTLHEPAKIAASTVNDITQHGVNYWLITGTTLLSEYDENFVATGNTINLSGKITGGCYGICSDGTFLYITENAGKQIRQITTSGIFTGVTQAFPTAATTYYKIEHHQGKFYLSNGELNTVTEYDGELVPTGVSWALKEDANSTSNAGGLKSDGVNLLISSTIKKHFYFYDATGNLIKTEIMPLGYLVTKGVFPDGSKITGFADAGSVHDRYTFDFTGGYTHVGHSLAMTDFAGNSFYKRVK